MALMGPGAGTTMAGKALIRGVQRAIRDMPERELRENLTDIRNRLDEALNVPQTVAYGAPLPVPLNVWEGDDFAGDDLATGFTGD